ncbi:MAG: DUF465 domain-containing protein [Kordiimonadaceae bacterium]|jgi:hypothetical protein|nr:DUF465 domain-containing protein [Kordiimonadaceae bacterium]
MNFDETDILEKIQQLRVQHRDLDDAIAALISSGTTNMLQIKRLKKQKLNLRDKIVQLENDLLPDIIA